MRRRASLLTRLMVKLEGPAVALGPGMVELIASLLIDLSEQKLYVVNPQHRLLRTMPVSSGRSSSPTPIGASKVLSKFASVTMRGRGYVTPGVPWVLCINPEATVCLHGHAGYTSTPPWARLSRSGPEGPSPHRRIAGMALHRIAGRC